jgi:hypothetical protein
MTRADFALVIVVINENKNMVEAGRIELPSEETNDREHSCFSTFIFVS